jgi:hypothetical protein
MSKRAALIVTDANTVRVALYDDAIAAVTGDAEPLEVFVYAPGSQLLADLRTTVHLAETRLLWNEVNDLSPKTYADWTERVARVRALLPEGDEDE